MRSSRLQETPFPQSGLGNRKPRWSAVVGGLRAYPVLREILQFLGGQKLEEAKRGLEFFAPDGYREGHFGGYGVWPESDFPLRKRGKGRYEAGLKARNRLAEGQGVVPSIMDLCCMRISNALLRFGPTGRVSQMDIAKLAGLDRSTVIHHLKHLEGDSFVLKESVHQQSGPRLFYMASPKLLKI